MGTPEGLDWLLKEYEAEEVELAQRHGRSMSTGKYSHNPPGYKPDFICPHCGHNSCPGDCISQEGIE